MTYDGNKPEKVKCQAVTICHRRPSQLALGAQVAVWWKNSVGSGSPESPEMMSLARAPFSQLLTLPSDHVRRTRGDRRLSRRLITLVPASARWIAETPLNTHRASLKCASVRNERKERVHPRWLVDASQSDKLYRSNGFFFFAHPIICRGNDKADEQWKDNRFF